MWSKMSLHMSKIIDISSRKCVKVENSIYSFVSGFRETDWYETLSLTFRLYWVGL